MLITDFGIHLNDVHDVIIRHLRLRNVQAVDRQGEPDSFGDGIELSKVERVVIDHVSVSWQTDEGIGAELGTPLNQDITIQNSSIAEGLWNGEHLGAIRHSRGVVVSDGSFNSSIHHNFMTGNNRRSPSRHGRQSHAGESTGLPTPTVRQWPDR